MTSPRFIIPGTTWRRGSTPSSSCPRNPDSMEGTSNENTEGNDAAKGEPTQDLSEWQRQEMVRPDRSSIGERQRARSGAGPAGPGLSLAESHPARMSGLPPQLPVLLRDRVCQQPL